MEKSQHAELQQTRLNWLPENLKRDIGQFNVFPLKDPDGPVINCQPYDRKGYYKISILNGHTRLYYADKSLEVKESALLFTNPNVPYAWEHVGENQSGYFCVFTETFFDHFGHIKDYPVFKPGSSPLFELSPVQAEHVTTIFGEMLREIASDYTYKYDVLRGQVMDLIHSALKMQPAVGQQYNASNGTLRVASMFTELLERQFPIESPMQRMHFRYPAEFAEQLSVHVNSLNRALKEITGKTTSQLIAERITQEARGLLKNTDWNISEIAWSLGFEELPHFINFFKKNEHLTPKSFRRTNEV
ncbi:helix-turn-helix domain-containing protein [Mucilaginibacter jinjuensis]|uniref:Helix-turn-helix transcriptional regulator n=1 Tax=Mucilaginibacter jinjuensis TaxID=1176721 RepID=A0ABY7TA39_9SPHI|nr:helix-turn-helix transcriptional regulator [Mucilaginibacter jinjuensis]WCT13364.1 helix-turn-helix transcriptional regulator [Mucilaginibacter jinjuensis]